MNSVLSPTRWSTLALSTGTVLGLLVTVSAVSTASTAAAECAPTSTHTKTVTNTNNSGPGSLRAAFFKVNNPALAWDAIAFNIPGAGNHVITPLTNLPPLTAPVVIDGYSQPGSSPATSTAVANLDIIIDGSNVNRGVRLTTDESLVQGLVIRDVANGAGDGLYALGDCNTFAGNYVGVAAGGATAAGNVGEGIEVIGDGNTVGGADPAQRNVVSANGAVGVRVSGQGNLVAGNRIGTNAFGDAALGNLAGGIELSQGGGNVVTGNLVSGNVGFGVSVDAGATNATLADNLIGTDVDAAVDLGNTAAGVRVLASDAVLLDNVISGNGGAGVDAQADNLTLLRNTIGVVATSGGTAPVPNDGGGVLVEGDDARIGSAGAGNTVAANGAHGIRLRGDRHVVESNYVGTDSVGALGLGNARDGIFLQGADSVIGGATSASGNVSSGNGEAGVHVLSVGGARVPSHNEVVNNLIGTAPNGLDPLPNLGDGVLLQSTEVQVTTNTIWFNGESGIEVLAGTHNPLVGNSITGSGEIGIDLAPAGVTGNDVDDPDSGANDLLNYPLMVQAKANAGGTHVTWRMSRGLPSSILQFEFFASSTCDGSGFGEALRTLGTFTAATDANGDLTTSTQLAGASTIGESVSATATVVPVTGGSTSELSACITVS